MKPQLVTKVSVSMVNAYTCVREEFIQMMVTFGHSTRN